MCAYQARHPVHVPQRNFGLHVQVLFLTEQMCCSLTKLMYIKTIDEMQTNNIPVLVFVLQVIFTVDGLPFVLGSG